MPSFWCHHGANYNTSSLPTGIPPLKVSQYRSPITAPQFPPLSNAHEIEYSTPVPPLHSILHDLQAHYKRLDDPSARDHTLVRDLVRDWNERRLLAYWKCLEHHPWQAVEIVRLMGLDFGEGKTDVVVVRALRSLRRYPRRGRWEAVARELRHVGNADAVLGLENPQFVLSCRDAEGGAV